MRVALVILAAIAAVMGPVSQSTTAPDKVTRIVGGSGTSIERYPYMSNMQYHYFGIWWIQWCGGSLITTTTVLSAAHCYIGDHPSEWRVALGSAHVQQGTNHPVSALIIHSRYNDATVDADIAIVRLATPAVLSATVGVARVAGPNYNLADGSTVTAIGWGALTPGGQSPTMLQHVDINIINQELCVERYEHLKTQPGFQNWPSVTDNMLCAGILDVGGKDACQGDSGGPLAHDRDVLVGVTSWGYSCAHPEYPGVNARVSYFTDWIVENA